MRKSLALILTMLFALNTTAFASAGYKTTDLTIIYATISLVSFLVLLGYFFVVKQKTKWLTLLFTGVFVVNIGYWLLSVSADIQFALRANRIAYLGSVCLPMAMYFIISDVCKINHNKLSVWIATVVAVVVFLLAASPGFTDVYYKSVSLEIVDGMAVLTKTYGPLHFVYLVYLVGYFSAMIVTIVYSTVSGFIASNKFAIYLLSAVAINIAVWFAEQIADFRFEYLSVSYIITEIFLLNTYTMLRDIVNIERASSSTTADNSLKDDGIAETARYVCENMHRLTPTEKKIFDMYRSGRKTSDVTQLLGIKESTLKFHNSNIYGKLGVKSKKQLMECVNYINRNNEN